MPNILLVAIASFLIAFSSCYWVIRLLAPKLLDIPNNRSSHSIPTPRGGGIALFACLAAYLIASIAADTLPPVFSTNQWLAIFLVFAISLADDLFSISIAWRLLVQLVCALLVIYPLVEPLTLSTWQIASLLIISTISMAWITNLYNFMDGINGIAAIEGITCCVALWIINEQSNLIDNPLTLIILGSACLGFLWWNFPRAKLFMGDSGSATLGFTMACLAAPGIFKEPQTLVIWLIILGVFIVDASFTLIRRALTGQKFYAPHRSHSYQRAADTLGHTRTSIFIGAINLCWLMPIAWLVQDQTLGGITGLAISYSPLVAIAIGLKAGKKISPDQYSH